jgi:hypothetical protein
MPETTMVDEEVARTPAPKGRGLAARPTHDETVAPDGKATAQRSSVEDENHTHRAGRTYKESTEKLLAQIEKDGGLAPHEEGDADEDEPADDGDDSEGADDSADETAAEADADDVGDADEGDDGGDEAPALTETAARLEARNRELLTELETARKTPKAQRSERETALVSAEASYYDEGSVPALRKFLSVIVGAAPDSKEVDAELSGLYTDLTARELGVTLDDNQRNLRDNARTRLLLARDKREKVEADKKPVADNSADTVKYDDAAKHIDNLLITKGQSGTSHADEYPMLMTLAEDFDGFKPGEVLARAIRREIETGSLDPKLSDIELVRSVAPKIEKHYAAVAKKIEAATKKNKKTDTTTPSGKKPKVAVEESTEQRQSTGARTITNATASRAPAKNPKVEKQKAGTTTEKTRKDFPSDAAWKNHLFEKHFKS